MRRAAKWVALASTVLASATVISPPGAFAAGSSGASARAVVASGTHAGFGARFRLSTHTGLRTAGPGTGSVTAQFPARAANSSAAIRGQLVSDVPAAPVLTATSSYHAVQLQWQNEAAGTATAHTVYRGSTADTLTKLADLPATQDATVTYTDRTGQPGTPYLYAVSDSDDAGEGAQSTPVSAAAGNRAVVYATNAYNDNYQIAMVDELGATRELTTDAGDHDTPAVSPDGNRFSYTSDAGNARGDYDVWVGDLNGGSRTRLTSGTSTADGSAAWSPDGTRLAFVRYGIDDGMPSIWLVSATGGSPAQVPGTTGDFDPSWSPSGRLLAVSHVVADRAPIVVTSLDGGYRRTVYGTSGSAFGGYDPSWSPDGGTIAFLRSSATADQVARISDTGGSATILTPAGYSVQSLDWSPDGTRIVFERDTSGVGDSLFWVNPDGSSITPVIGGGNFYRGPGAVAAPRAAYHPTTPAAPARLNTTLANGAVELSWVGPTSGYVMVRRSTAGGPAPQTPESGGKVYTGTADTAVATGLTNGAVYTFSIFSMSTKGDASTPVSRVAQPAVTPVIQPNGSVLASLYLNGPRFTATWGKALPTGQVYDVELGSRTLSNGTYSSQPVWSNLAVGTRALSQVVNAKAGTDYYLRARVRDSYGNISHWSAEGIAPVPYDDRAFASTGTWAALTGQPSRYQATLRTSATAGAKLSIAASGTSLSVVGERCSGCGQLKIYLDGVLKATVDSYAKTTSLKQLLWTSTSSTLRRHTLSVVVVGTASRPTVRIDGLVARR